MAVRTERGVPGPATQMNGGLPTPASRALCDHSPPGLPSPSISRRALAHPRPGQAQQGEAQDPAGQDFRVNMGGREDNRGSLHAPTPHPPCSLAYTPPQGGRACSQGRPWWLLGTSTQAKQGLP